MGETRSLPEPLHRTNPTSRAWMVDFPNSLPAHPESLAWIAAVGGLSPPVNTIHFPGGSLGTGGAALEVSAWILLDSCSLIHSLNAGGTGKGLGKEREEPRGGKGSGGGAGRGHIISLLAQSTRHLFWGSTSRFASCP